MFDFAASHHQVGIRQRSLKRHCRVGRATELVFMLATGVAIVIGGQANSQSVPLDTAGAYSTLSYWDPLGFVDANASTFTLHSPSSVSGAWELVSSVSAIGNWTNMQEPGQRQWIEPGGESVAIFDAGGGFMNVTTVDLHGSDDRLDMQGIVFRGNLTTITPHASIPATLGISSAISANSGATGIIDTAITSTSGVLTIAPTYSVYGAHSLADGGGTVILGGGVTGSVVMQAPGTLQLAGGTITGSVESSAGTVKLNSGTLNGSIATSTGARIELNGTTLSSRTLFLFGGTTAVGSTLVDPIIASWAGDATLEVSSGGNLTFTSDLTIDGTRALDIKSGGTLNAPNIDLSSTNATPFSSAGTINANLQTSGTNGVITGGALNGNLQMTAGSFSVGGGASLTGDVSIANGATLNMTGDVSVTGNVTQLGATSAIVNTTAGNVTLTVNTGDLTHAGILNGGGPGGGGDPKSLTIVGSYTASGGSILGNVVLPASLLTITGPGATTVNANIAGDVYVDGTGVMQVTANSTVGSPVNSVFDVENDNIVNVESGVVLTASSFKNSATLNLLGTGAVSLTENGTVTGFGDRNAFVNAGTVAFGAGAALTARDRVENETGSSMTFAGDATITVDSDNDGTANAETFINDGTINLSGGAGGTVTVTSPTDVTMTNTANGALTVATGWELDVSGMNSGGTQDLTNTGSLTMSGGTLTGNVLNSAALNMDSGTIDGTLYNNSATGLTLAGGRITGGLGLQAGTTTVNVTGNARVDGQLTVGTGRLNIQAGNTLRSSTILGQSGSTIDLYGTVDGRVLLQNGTLNLAGDILLAAEGSGNLENLTGFATSQINVIANSQVEGLVDIFGGELDIASGVNLAIDNTMDIGTAGALDVNNGTIIGSVNSAGATDIAGSVTGTYRQQGGTTNISGASTIGTVLLEAGTMTVAAGQTLNATNGITVGDGVTSSTATLTINGSTTGNITMNQDGVLNANGGSAIGDTASVTVNNGQFNVNANETIGSLSKGGAAGSVALGANRLTIAGTATSNIGGAVTGNGGLTFTGGTNNVTAALAYAGTTQLTGGSLNLTGSGALTSRITNVTNAAALTTDGGAFNTSSLVDLSDTSSTTLTGDETIGVLNLDSGATLALNNNARLTWGYIGSFVSITSGVISGTGGITLNPTGGSRLRLVGTNTYSGETQIGNGTLNVTGTSILDTGTVNVVGGTFELEADETIGALVGAGTAGTVNVQGNTLTIAGTGVAAGTTFDGDITGTGGLSIAGATANLTLSGNQSYTGATTVSAGSLTAQGTLATSGVTVSGGSFTLDATDDSTVDLALLTVTGTGAATMSGGDVTTIVNTGTTDGTTNVTVTGGDVATLTQTSGDLALNGGRITTFNQTGGATRVAGFVNLIDPAVVSGGSFTAGTGVSVTLGNSLTFSGTGALTAQGNILGSVTLGGTDTVTHSFGGRNSLSQVTDVSVTNANATVDVNRNGRIITLTNQGGTINAATNGISTSGYSQFGTLTNTSGTVNIDTRASLDTDMTNAGTLNVSAEFGDITGGTPVNVNNTGTVNLKTGADLKAGISQTAGTTDVQGNATVDRAIAVSGGTLKVSDGATLTATGSVDMSGTGVLDLDGMVTGDVDIVGTATTNTIGGGTGTDGVSGTLTQNNAGSTTTLTATDGAFGTSVGTLTNTAGTVEYTGDGSHVLVNASSNAGTLNIATGTTITASNGLTNTGIMDLNGTLDGTLTNSGSVNATGGTVGSVLMQNGGGFRVDFGGSATITDSFTLPGGALSLGSGASVTITNGFTLNGGALSLSSNATLTAASFDLTSYSALGLGNGARFVGTGNTFNLGVTIFAPADFGIEDVGAININNGGNLSFSNGGHLRSDTDDSGGESVNIKSGGRISVSSGTLEVSSGGTNPGGALNIANGGTLSVTNATLDVNQNYATTPTAGTIVSAGTVNLSGATIDGNLTQNTGGILNVTNSSTITGTTTINDGSLNITAGQELTADLVFGGTTGNVGGAIIGNLTVANGQTLTATGDLTYNSLTVNAGGTFTTTGAGGVNILGQTNTTTINGAAVYNGGDTLNDNGSIIVGYGASGAGVTFNTGGGTIVFNADADNDTTGTIQNGGRMLVGGGLGTVTMGTGTGDDNFLNASAATTGFDDGQLILGDRTTVNGIQTLTNESASATAILVSGGALLDVVTLNSTAGTITTSGEIDGNVALSGSNSAHLYITGGATVDGNVSTAGNATLEIGSNVGGTIEITGTYTQNSTGTSTVAGDIAGLVTVNDGVLTVNGGSAFQAGLDVNGGVVNVDAALSVTGNTTVDGATLNIANGGNLTGIVAAGTAGGAGSVVVGDGTTGGILTGDLATAGSATFDINDDGSVTGTVFAGAAGVTSELGGNIANLNITDTNTVTVTDTMTNSGLTFVDGGGTLAVQAGVSYQTGGGAVTVGFDAGNAGGAGTLTIADTGRVSPNVRVFNGGVVDINGSLGGAVEVGGSLTLTGNVTSTTSELAGDVGGSLVVQAGALTITGLSAVGNLLDVDGGTVNVNANTTITNATNIDGAGTQVVVADGVRLTSAGVTLGATTAGATLDVNGLIDGGGITVTDGTLLLGDGSGSTTVGGTVQFDAGTLTMTGPVDIDGTLDINGGTASVVSGEVTAADIDIAAAAGTMSINGTLRADTTTLSNAATLNVSAGGRLRATTALSNSGTITLGTNGSIRANTTLTNSGTITFADAGGLTAPTISNSGDIIVTAGQVSANGSALNNIAGGSLAVNGGSFQGFGAINNTSAEADAITVGDTAWLNFDTLTSSAGMITVGGGTTLMSGTSVALTGNADLDLNGGTIRAALDNQSSTQISLSGKVEGAFTQQGAGSETLIDGTGATFTTTANITSGTLNADANVDVASALSMGAGTTLDAADGVTINAGTMTLNGTTTAVLGNSVTLSTDTGLLDTAATMTFGTNGSLTSAAALSNSGAVTLGTNGTMTSVAAFDNVSGLGSITFNDGGTLSSGTGTLTNGGTITVNDGQVTTNNTSIVADGMGTGTTLSGGDLNLGTGTFTDNGTGNLTALTVAGDASGTATLTASALTFTEAQFDLDSTVNLATLDLGGTGTVTLNGVGQNSQLFGTINGLVDLNTGTLTVDGASSITGAITVDGAGTSLIVNDGVTLTNAGGVTVDTAALLDVNGNLTANVTNTNGTVRLGDGTGTTTVTGSLTQADGTTTVQGDTDVTAAMLINGGDLTVNALTTLDLTTVSAGNTLTVDTAATFTNNGTVVGAVLFTGGGAANVSGTFANLYTQNDAGAVTTIAGASSFQGGFVNTAGRVNVNAPLTLGAGASNAGTLDINANVLGGQTITNSGTATLSSGSFTGNYTQSGGTTTIDGNTALVGAGTGVFTLNGGSLDVSAGTRLQAVTMDFNAGSTVNIYDGATLVGTGNTHLNGGIENVLGATASFEESTGNIILEQTGSILMRSDQQQTLTMTLSTAGRSFAADAGSTISMIDATTADTTDRIQINGDAVLNGTVQMDVNISGATVGTVAADTADRITATGNITGATTLQLQNVNGTYSSIAAPVTLVESTGGSTAGLGTTLAGLPFGGSYIYSLNNTGTQVQLMATPNLAYGGLASGIAATQSLMSSVANRQAPDATPIAGAFGDGTCSPDTWARVTGGKNRARLNSTSVTTGMSADNDVSLSYGGVQMGVGNTCVGGAFGGWDLAYGVTLGTNSGKTLLPVTLGAVATTMTAKFDQLYGGAYLNASKGNWSGSLNFRTDKTTYTLSESNAFGLGGLGLTNQTFESRGNTVSGELSYSHTLDDARNIKLMPTLGFRVSKVRTGAITIENDPTTTADNAVLQIGDITQKIGYLGATISRTDVRRGGREAVTYFASGTYFKDFSKDVTSTFTATATGAQQQLTSKTLGDYGEIGLGMNYSKVLSGSGSNARRLNAGIRADVRVSNKVDSWGVTAQVRIEF
ncbi:hypothetical protein [Pseudooceanicola sp. MF1-13]|uniref:hypothetical protein n=1 Tax=Pseudooceanicola sp. MF1-13 TaxID=3379095 RepID=UPI0038922D3F